MILEAGEPKFKVPTRIAPGRALLGLQKAIFSLCPDMTEKGTLAASSSERAPLISRGIPLHHLICTQFSLHTGQNTRFRLQPMRGAEMSSC